LPLSKNYSVIMRKIFTLIFVCFFYNIAAAQTFSNNTGGAIPDGNGITEPDPGPRVCFPINVTGVGLLTAANGLKSVCINITHTFDADLIIFLKAPNGEYIPLSGIPGPDGDGNGDDGDNYTNTCFSMTATTPISLGTAPFTGSYIPEYSLGWFNDNNINANGTWSLCVEDNYLDDIGNVTSWNITFGSNAPPFPIAGCNGNLPANNFCQNATPICNLNGYCGNTSEAYSAYVWDELENAFCGSIENNSFIKFVSTAATATFNVNVTNSAAGDGIQMMVFSGGCGSGAVTDYGCINQMPPGPNTFIATGLTPGNTYYLMIDGFAGDICDYSITAISGVNVLNVTPAAPGICTGGTGVVLTASGGNGTYTWSPATGLSATTGATVTANPSITTTYTVTSGAIGSLNCPLSKTVTVTVNPPPVVSAPATVCVGNTVTLSPVTGGTWTSSNNAVATVTNAGVVTGVSPGNVTFTFTNTATGCSSTTSSVTVTAATITPTFNPIAPICSGAAAPVLPTTSTNGVSGNWNPSVVSNTANGTYTFTPNPGQCAGTTTLSVTVNPNVTPAFNPIAPICSGAVPPVLPATSTNGITGTWSPATVSNTASGTYTFTPTAGQCATTATLTVTVNPNLSPVVVCGNGTATSVTFNWGAVTGATGYTISYTINAGIPISGGVITATTYSVTGLVTGSVVAVTITPTGSGCFSAGTVSCTAVPCVAATAVLTSAAGTDNQTRCINTVITDITYNIGGSATGAGVTGLPAGVTGAYNAGVFTISGTPTATGVFNYTVTTTGGCSVATASGTITVNAPVTPTFNPIAPICSGAAAPMLAATSTNGITGSWSPAVVSNTVTGIYTFTPTAGQCANTATLTVTVNPNVTPTFTQVQTLCVGNTPPALPAVSNNGITGTWSPAVISTVAPGSTVHTFTPNAGQCAVNTNITVVVNATVTPVFNPILPFCAGSTAPALPATSVNGISGTWSPAVINNNTSGLYTFTPSASAACATNATLPVVVLPLPNVNLGNDTTICESSVFVLNATVPNPLAIYLWQDGSTNPTYTVTQPGNYSVIVTSGPCSKTDNINISFNLKPRFTLGDNTTICPGQTLVLSTGLTDPLLDYLWQDGSTNATLTVTQPGTYYVDVSNTCGPTRDTIDVSKGVCKVFMPSVFTPNRDGVNDVFRAGGGEDVTKYSLAVYNRYGQKIFETNDIKKGWDGTYKGARQPEGTYVYYVVYTDPQTNKVSNLKGTVVLLQY
jgi:gliding motility-associated-like protein